MKTISDLFQKPDSQIDDFIAPLPLDVAVDRLQSRNGKFFDIETEVQTQQIDADQYSFQMRVMRQEKNFLLKVYGTLNRQDETTTHVLVARDYELDYAPLVKYSLSLAVMGLLLGALVNLPILALFMIPVGVIVGVIVDRVSPKYDPVVLMIQEALDARTPDDKAKADPTA
jgi:hypothetical protein